LSHPQATRSDRQPGHSADLAGFLDGEAETRFGRRQADRRAGRHGLLVVGLRSAPAEVVGDDPAVQVTFDAEPDAAGR